MLIRNLFDSPCTVQSIHHGKGRGKNALVFDAADFDTPCKFIRYVELEPDASIGNHPHGQNEEVYVVLSGNGVMIVNGASQAVKPGDVILNKPGWQHGLENASDEPLKVLVFEVDVVQAK
jgi:mannose-6-phosphate isomerase-like protein (cupin superfamily)